MFSLFPFRVLDSYNTLLETINWFSWTDYRFSVGQVTVHVYLPRQVFPILVRNYFVILVDDYTESYNNSRQTWYKVPFSLFINFVISDTQENYG